MMKELLSRQECAEYLRISVRTLDRRIKEGKIRCVQHCPGGRILIRQKDVDKYLRSIVR